MAKTVESLDKDLEVVIKTVDEQASQISKLESRVAGLEGLATRSTAPAAVALPTNHVFSATRRGLADYEEARTKLSRQKVGEVVTINHLGKSIECGYDLGHQLLRDAKILS